MTAFASAVEPYVSPSRFSLTRKIVFRFAGRERRRERVRSSRRPRDRTSEPGRRRAAAARLLHAQRVRLRAERAVVAEDRDRDEAAAARRDHADVLVVRAAVVGDLHEGDARIGNVLEPGRRQLPVRPPLRLTGCRATYRPAAAAPGRGRADGGGLRRVEREVVVGGRFVRCTWMRVPAAGIGIL